MMQLRRLLPRQFADWEGSCLVEEDAGRRWHDCRIADISSAGAGLSVLDRSSEMVAGNHILVVVRLRAEIRHASADRQGQGTRVGAQFVDLTDTERDYLDSVVNLGARW